VGIDNRMAGFILTDHLLKLGCRKIGFFNRPCSAETVFGRLTGYREALERYSITPQPAWAVEGDPSNAEVVRDYLEASGVEAIVCANDITAANLMRTLDLLGVQDSTRGPYCWRR